MEEEHEKHDELVTKAKAALWIRYNSGDRDAIGAKKTAWHTDEEPPIAGLPEGTAVAYKIAPHGGSVNVRIRLQVEGNEKADKGDLAHLVGQEFGESVYFTRDGQGRQFDSGVVTALEDISIFNRRPLMAMDVESADFALIERAVDVVTGGEKARWEAARNH